MHLVISFGPTHYVHNVQLQHNVQMVHQTQVIGNKALHFGGVGKTLHIFASTFVQVSENKVGKCFPTTKVISHSTNMGHGRSWCADILRKALSAQQLPTISRVEKLRLKQGGTLY